MVSVSYIYSSTGVKGIFMLFLLTDYLINFCYFTRHTKQCFYEEYLYFLKTSFKRDLKRQITY